MKTIFAKSMYDAFIEFCDKEPKKETCYIIIGEEGNTKQDALYQIPNIAKKNLAIEFVMHPQALFELLSKTKLLDKASKLVLKATLHSHPTGFPVPSTTDYEHLQYNVLHYIYGMQLKGLEQDKYKPVRCWKYNRTPEKQFFDEVIFEVK